MVRTEVLWCTHAQHMTFAVDVLMLELCNVQPHLQLKRRRRVRCQGPGFAVMSALQDAVLAPFLIVLGHAVTLFSQQF